MGLSRYYQPLSIMEGKSYTKEATLYKFLVVTGGKCIRCWRQAPSKRNDHKGYFPTGKGSV